jgi:glycosyltransferase involved in cell wall biosynthesis
MKIAVVTPKMASGERGGAENLYEGLVNALNAAGHTATQVNVVVDESSFESILEAYSNCFYLDLNDYDLVISTKAPTYMVRHKNHISYLLHTIRVFYDMFDVEFNPKDKEKQKQRRLIHEFDKYGLSPKRVKKHFVNGSTVYKRMIDVDDFWKNVNFEVLHHPPRINDFRKPQKGEFIFFPSRLHRWKRPDLIIKSMKYVGHNIDLIISGRGEDENYYKELAKSDNRIKFAGWIDEEKLVDLYSRSIVVPFVPLNEDYGLITIEAFKSKKPVITCTDSGESVYIVKEGISGFVVEPDPKKIAEKIDYLIDNPDEAKRMGEEGYNSVQEVMWENVVMKLLRNVEIVPEEKVTPKINVLFTDMQPIEPAIGGGRLRLKGLYSNLPQNINALYVGTYDWKGPKHRKIQISNSFLELDIPLDNEHFRLNEDINRLLPGKTIIDVIFPFLAEASPEYVETVRHEAKKSDVVVLSHPWLYPTLKTEVNLKNKLIIYDSQNCEAILREQILGETPFAKCIIQMVKFVERELCEDCDLIIACSETDKKQFEELYDLNPDKIEIFPNGVDVGEIKPVDNVTRRKSKEKLKLTEKTAIFIGSEYTPNVEAGRYIIDELAEECPDVTFLIVGGAGNKLDSRNKKNVKIFGMVSDEDKKMLYSAADIAINPMSSGSGTNIKMFEYLAAELPTISSPVGARGIENKGSFIVTDLLKFPNEIRKVLSDENLCKELSVNGRALVERYYDWNRISYDLGKRVYNLYFGQSPYFSVIVPMYRGEYINKLVEHLNQQAFKDFEVLIVDNSGEERGDALHNLLYNFNLKYLKSDIGAAKARNRGIQYARGKIIVFTDDDCQPDADWLMNAKSYFENDNMVGLEGYIYTDDSKINDPKYRIVTNKGFEGIGFMTANLFIRRDIVEKIVGFDERFDKPFREDTDFAWRAQNYGAIPFAKNVRVFHPPFLRKLKGESKKDRDRFFVYDALLFVKHPEKYIDLMKAEGHYKNIKNFWGFFLDGCKHINDKIPIEYMLKDPEIRRYVPDELKESVQKRERRDSK